MATSVTWIGGTDNSWNTAANWSDAAVPSAGDDVSIPAGADDITSGLDQSAIALGMVRIEDGYSGLIGDNTVVNNPTYLEVDCDSFECHGECTSYIDLSHPAGAVDVTVTRTVRSDSGRYGMYLKGGDVDDLDIQGGAVGVATFHGAGQTVANVRVSGGSLHIGQLAAVTNYIVHGGIVKTWSESGFTTLKMNGGNVTLQDSVAGTWTVMGGHLFPNKWSGSPTLTVEGGTADFSKSGLTRTLSVLNHNGGNIIYDPNVLTITTRNAPASAVRISVSQL